MLILSCAAYSQVQAQFFLNGTATSTNDSCFQLTTAENWQVGSVWNGTKVNLDQSFEVVFNLYAGCVDGEGADGIVFGLQPISTSIGIAGGDLGIGNVAPSLGVEFDTYQNIDYDDPEFDHIAIIQDGNVRHNVPQNTLAGPIQANLNDPNIEDCEYHPAKVTWDAQMQTMSVYLDCELRLTYTGDIVNEIFDGDPEVFWGFTAATGGLNNVQEVCLSYTTFIDGLVDQIICPGLSVPLEVGGGLSYQWSPAEGLSDPTIANPIATPEETTLYTVEILDECGIPFFDEVLITVTNEQFDVEIISFPDNLISISTGSDIGLVAEVDTSGGATYTYAWTSQIGSVFSHPDSSNTVLTSSVNQIGTEVLLVEVTSENGCVVRDSIVLEITGTLFDVPNVFTPNGDGTNDTFGVITKEEVEIDIYKCKIFNRWGKLVFETDNHAAPWDGTYKDKAAASDVYVYLIELEIGGNRFQEKGDLTLLR